MISLEQQEHIKNITQKYNPKMVGIFGSYARNESTSKSDLDILIDFNTKINLIEIIGLEQQLSEILGIKVDLITKKSVNKNLKPFIEKDLIRLI
ncbi:MAG: nucleotidyltransferase family protein [Vicingaceae bacterium]